MNPLMDTETPLPYPAPTKTATTQISSIPTTATLTSFSDKLLLTITQHGKLAQWFTVSLAHENPSVHEGGMGLVGVGTGGLGGGGGYDYDYGDEDGAGDESHENGDGDTNNSLAQVLIPQSRFTARTLLGGGGTKREVFGGFLSRCVAGLIVGRDPGEERVLVVGLGLVGLSVGSGSGSGSGSAVNGVGVRGGEVDDDEQRREIVLRVLELVSRVL